MNIFAISRHPRMCAKALDDKRLNKMILETAQIICTVINKTEGSQVTRYRSSHVNHPATIWAETFPNALPWLYALGIAYGDEILYRHGRQHSCHTMLLELIEQYPWLRRYRPLREDQLWNGARHLGLGLDFTYLPTTQAYRAYLCMRWPNDKRTPVWTNRRPPSWFFTPEPH